MTTTTTAATKPKAKEPKITAIAPWFGSKRTLAPRIVAELGKHTSYFEPFCGSCSQARFDAALGRSRDKLLGELRRMRAQSIVISSNVETKGDGTPYANRRQPSDPGVAVYFVRNKQQQCIPCDRWDKVEDNIHAIYLTVAALRGIERWGSGKMMDAAFTGFKALPTATIMQWWQVLNLPSNATADDVTTAYRRQAMLNHPDRGGDVDAMARINAAYEQFKKERGVV